MSQSASSQRTTDEKSNGKVSNFCFQWKRNYFDNIITFLFSKVSEKIEPSEENPSQSGSGQRTEDEKPNGKVSNFYFH